MAPVPVARVFVRLAGLTFFGVAVLSASGGAAQQGNGQGNPQNDKPKLIVMNPQSHAKSAPLRSYVKPDKPSEDREAPEVRPTAPGGGGTSGNSKPTGGGNSSGDPVKQTTYPPKVGPLVLASVQGITHTGSYPPDTNLAVGATQVVEFVNSQFAVFSKAGGVLQGATNLYQMFVNMTGDDCSWRAGGDPVVLYDRIAGRWVMTRYLFNPNILCIGVSQTSDALGIYNLYSYAFGPDTADYPKFGVWPDAYYFTANTFSASGPFTGAQVCAFDRYAMVNGLPNATRVCFQGNTSWHSLLPADLDSTLLPAAGAPGLFLQYDTDALSLFKFHVDFSTPANSTFTGPTSIPVASFQRACGSCVQQPSTKDELETLGDRLMFRVSYRNFGSYESVLATHAVRVSYSGNNDQTAIRWYELRFPGGNPSVYQQSTFSPDTTMYRWLGTMAQDKLGNMLLGYNAANSTTFPSVRFTMRLVSDPLNQMQPEQIAKIGAGSQTVPADSTSGRDRWGDYATVAVDPADGCSMWFATEYLTATGPSNTWATHLFAAKLGGCN
jgi:hypothetical protein